MLWQKTALLINQITELSKVLEDRIGMHLVAEFCCIVCLRIELKDREVDFFKAAERIHWPTITLRSLEKVFCPRIHPLVRILARSAPTATTSWGIALLAVRSFRVLLLHVSI